MLLYSNYHFYQMASTLKCKHAIIQFKDSNKNCALLLRKWEVLKELVRVLKLPFVTTNYLQRKNSTLSDFFGIMIGLEIGLRKEMRANGNKTNFSGILLSKISARKKNLLEHPLMTAAIYLDPRYKCELAKHPDKIVIAKITIEKLWQRIQSSEQNCDETSEMNISDKSNESISSIDLNSILSNIDRHYKEDDISNGSVEHGGANARLAEAMDAYDASVGNTRVNSSESVLHYWEKHKNTYSSELGKIANTIHAIPPTQSSIERLFSALNFIFSDRRYNLSQSLLENILLLHSNGDFFNIVKECELAEMKSKCNEV